MGLFDSLGGMLGGKKKDAGDIIDAVKDGKLDMNDAKNIAFGQIDSNDDGKLDAKDLDVNQDGSTDLKDIDAAKDKFGIK